MICIKKFTVSKLKCEGKNPGKVLIEILLLEKVVMDFLFCREISPLFRNLLKKDFTP